MLSTMLPPGATLDPTTGLFAWTPDYTEQGLYNVSFTVSNGSTSTTQSTSHLVVDPAIARRCFRT